MAGVSPPLAASPARELDPGTRHLLDSLPGTPAYVVDARYDVLAWNQLAIPFIGDLSAVPEADRNMLRWMFRQPADDPRWSDADTLAFARVRWRTCAPRTRRYPGDRRIEELVTELLGISPQFAAMWAEHEVVVRRPVRKRSCTRRPGRWSSTATCCTSRTPASGWSSTRRSRARPRGRRSGGWASAPGKERSMRVAVLADIHGNLPALDAVLRDVEAAGVDAVVLDGDIADGPMPAQTLDRLAELGDRVIWVRGNSDRDLAAAFDGTFQPSGLATNAPAEYYEWCAARISQAQRDLLADLPLTVSLDIDGLGPVAFCHGTARDDNEFILVDSPVEHYRAAFAGLAEQTVVRWAHAHAVRPAGRWAAGDQPRFGRARLRPSGRGLGAARAGRGAAPDAV